LHPKLNCYDEWNCDKCKHRVHYPDALQYWNDYAHSVEHCNGNRRTIKHRIGDKCRDVVAVSWNVFKCHGHRSSDSDGDYVTDVIVGGYRIEHGYSSAIAVKYCDSDDDDFANFFPDQHGYIDE